MWTHGALKEFPSCISVSWNAVCVPVCIHIRVCVCVFQMYSIYTSL